MMANEKRYKISAYNQLVRNSGIQALYNLLAPYGYNIEFMFTKDLDNKEHYSRGSDNALLRDKNIWEQVKLLPSANNKKNLKNFLNKTIVIAYNVTPMRNTLEKNYKDIRKTTTCNKLHVLGYTHAKINNPTTNTPWEPQTIPPMHEVIEGSQEILEIDPLSTYLIEGWQSVINLDTAPNDTQIVEALKSKVRVDFELSFNILTISEKIQKEINFIILESLCNKTNIPSTEFVELEFLKNQKFYSPYQLIKGAIESLDTLGGTKDIRMYNIPFTYQILEAPLFSEYTKYQVLGSNQNVEIVLKLGILGSNTNNILQVLYNQPNNNLYMPQTELENQSNYKTINTTKPSNQPIIHNFYIDPLF